MRTDHFAYQRATKVAGVGLLMQIVIGIGLLVFGMLSSPRDLPLIYAALYVLPGVLVWLGLVIVYHQHKLERLESLEEDELAAAASVQVGVRPVSRGIARGGAATWSHAQVVPTRSEPGSGGGAGGARLAHDHAHAGPDWSEPRGLCGHRSARLGGRHLPVPGCCLLHLLAFVAGMAKQKAWADLHAGRPTPWAMRTVLVAIAIGIIFRFLENENVIYVVTWGIPILMGLLAAEVTLNFILNLYRPRIPGEVQRPAFDSRD